MNLPKKNILGLAVSTGSYENFIDQLTQLSVKKKSAYICVANVHMLVEAYRDKTFAQILENADMVTPDGAPLAKSLYLLYGEHQDRVAGMDLMPSLIKETQLKDISIFFYGSTDSILKSIEIKIQNEFPGVKIAGLFSPPFRDLTAAEENEIIDKINSSGAGFVFVALGCPKQEKWMAGMKGKINAVMIGLGGAFPVFAGTQKRAPLWMQKASLEWLYRLIQEPTRLFKRYAITNAIFLRLLLQALIVKKFKNILQNK